MIIIDRFEENKAVLEIDGKAVVVDRTSLPDEAHEGDVLVFAVDKSAKNDREERIKSLVNDLFND